MTMDDRSLAYLDAVGQADLVRRGELTPEELVEAAIRRVERLDPELHAVIHPAFDDARRESPRVPRDAPFAGVPILMKDIGGEEAGRPVCAGLRAARDADFTASVDSHLTRKLRGAGFVSLGRTNTPELALLPTTEPDAFAPTHNPWNLGHSAGGSSGGAAAAVAAGLVPVAHASDGGGSIRGPASMCGLVGLKPTRGRTSFGPGLGERWSGFSCELVVSRTVRDSAALLDVTAGRMTGDPYSAPPPARPFTEAVDAGRSGLRIGLMRHAPRDIEVHPDIVTAVEHTAETLESLGHRVELAHPKALDEPDLVRLYVDVVCANVARALESWGERLGCEITADGVEPLTWALAERGRGLSATRLLAAIEGVHGFGRRVADFFGGDGGSEGFDLLLTPTQAQPPPELGYMAQMPDNPLGPFLRAAPYGVFTLPFNLSGQPAISVPGHFTSGAGGTPADLPVGVQLVAASGDEAMLLDVAAQLERATLFSARTPPVFG
jgi:amidase